MTLLLTGAGKTETAKLVLKYLVGREMFQASSAVKGESREDSPLEQKLLQSSPILEAFGNSKSKHSIVSYIISYMRYICIDSYTLLFITLHSFMPS